MSGRRPAQVPALRPGLRRGARPPGWAGLAALLVAAACGVTGMRAAAAEPIPLERLRNGDLGGLLAVEMAVGGLRGRWLIDTGSSEHVVDAAVAERLGLAAENEVSLRTTLGLQRGRRVRLPALALGDWQAKDVPAVRLDLQPLVGTLGLSVDGVLGAPLLAERALRLDLSRQTLELLPARGAACEPGRRIALEAHRGIPLVALDSALGPAQWHLLDSGNPGALVRLAADPAGSAGGLVLELPQPGGGPLRLSLLSRVSSAGGAALQRERVPLARLPANALGEALPARIVGSAGVALFDGGRWRLDLPGGQLCLEEPPALAALPGGFGLLLAQGPLGPRIAAALPGSPAALAGLQPSDEITGLDGQAAPRTVPAFWHAVGAHGAMELEVRRAGASRRLRLARAWFLPPED